LTEAGQNPGKLAYIVPLPTLDSSFAVCTSKGPKSMSDPDLPALLLAIAYMDAVEGPLWKYVKDLILKEFLLSPVNTVSEHGLILKSYFDL